MILVILVVIFIIIALIKEIARPDLIMLGALVLLLITDVVTPKEALSGFSNEGMLTIALLFIIAGAIQKSGIFETLIMKILGNNKNDRLSLIKMMSATSSLSVFLNNTPIVVTFLPFVKKWAESNNLSTSKFLIPLSYATILGGTISLMGTSTNLVVHGLLIENGFEGFTLFQLAYVGIPITIVGLIYLSTIGYKLLPNYKNEVGTLKEESRDYLVEINVETICPLINKTVEEAELRNLEGLYLVGIIRNDKKISPISSSEKIMDKDKLIFTGLISTIAELEKIKGFQLETGSDLTVDTLKNGDSSLVEAVVSHQSSLLYQKIKDTNFRSKYDAAIIAVNRNHERIKSKIGDIVLRPGDTVLLITGKEFSKRKSMYNDFYVTTYIDHPFKPLNIKKSWFTVLSLITMILFVLFGVLSMFKAMSIEVVLLLLTKVITTEEAKKSIQFNVLLLIASAFGIGIALSKTGVATLIASTLVNIVQPLGIIFILIIVYLLTNIFTELITNSAAAALMFPIGMEVALYSGINEIAIAIIIAIAASASFISPIGYQTNLIVYGPGGYKFSDYFKVGLPLSLIVMTVTVAIVYNVMV